MICAEFGRSRDDYDFGDVIGEGGFGKVYWARCKKNQKIVAIKKIDRSRLNGKLRKRVNEEILIQSRLSHPSILKLFAYFEDDLFVYIVIEYCPNGDLLRCMKRNGGIFTENQTREYFSQVVDGVLYLHSLDIIHRDLTLCNVLLDPKGRVKIADFGLATKLKGPQDRQMTMCGTPNYMSPEVATMSSHGLETDVWSLGCMLYTMIVGVAPFETNNKQLTMRKVASGDYEIPERVSIEARDLITKCLMPNPSKRISSEGIRQHQFFIDSSSTSQRVDSGVFTISTTATTQHTRPPLSAVSERVPTPGCFSHPNTDRRINTPPVRLKSNPVEFAQNQMGMLGVLKKKFAGLPELIKNDAQSSYYVMPSNPHCHSMPTSNFCAAQSLPTASTRERDISEERKHQRSLAEQSSSYKRSNPPHGCCHVRVSQCSCGSGRSDHGIEADYNQCSAQNVDNITCRSVPANAQDENCPYPSHRSRSLDRGGCVRGPPNTPRSSAAACSPHRMSIECDRNASPVKSACGVNPSASLHTRRSHSMDYHPKPEQSDFVMMSQHAADCGCNQCNKNSCTCNKNSSTHRSWCNKGLSSSEHPIHNNNNNNNQLSAPIQDDIMENNVYNLPSYSQNYSLNTYVSKSYPQKFNSTKNLSISTATLSRENTTRSSTSKDTKPQGSLCSPIKTDRLGPVRQEVRKGVLHILKTGQISMEFFQRPGKVDCIFKIFQDGQKVSVFQPNALLSPTPPDSSPEANTQQPGKSSTFELETMPKKHWKKYNYTARLVKMVKAKKPKVTCYSERAKGVLMENGPDPDFDCVFYTGQRFLFSGSQVHFSDESGSNLSIPSSEARTRFDPRTYCLFEHALEVKSFCTEEELYRSKMNRPGFVNFPVTIGRRPPWVTPQTPKPPPIPGGKENFSPQSEMSYKPTHSVARYNNSADSMMASELSSDRRPPSRTRKPLTPNQDTNIMNESEVSSRKRAKSRESKHFVEDVGWAVNNGKHMRVEFLDGTAFRIDAGRPSLFVFEDLERRETTYSGSVPKRLLDKLIKFQRAVQSLAPETK